MKSLSVYTRRPLGDILVSEFSLKRRALLDALGKQREQGGLLGHILLASGEIDSMSLVKALIFQRTAMA